MTSQENWRPVPSWEGYYEVSDLGRVRSVERAVEAKNPHGEDSVRRFKSRELKPSKPKNGYPMVSLTAPGRKREYRYVHSLVLEAFVGPRPQGLEVCHNDGSRNNNRLDNLRYDTRSANYWDRAKHGTMHFGVQKRKLTADQVRQAAALYPSVSMRRIGTLFGVSHHTVSKALAPFIRSNAA